MGLLLDKTTNPSFNPSNSKHDYSSKSVSIFATCSIIQKRTITRRNRLSMSSSPRRRTSKSTKQRNFSLSHLTSNPKSWTYLQHSQTNSIADTTGANSSSERRLNKPGTKTHIVKPSPLSTAVAPLNLTPGPKTRIIPLIHHREILFHRISLSAVFLHQTNPFDDR